jgi:hypothetical protein
MDDERTRLDRDRDRDRERRQALFRRRHVALTAFLHELTAEALESARDLSGEPRASTRWPPSKPASSSCISRRTTGERGKSR